MNTDKHGFFTAEQKNAKDAEKLAQGWLCRGPVAYDIFQSMSTLAEIEAAAEALPPEQKTELLRFLTARLRQAVKPLRGARLVAGPDRTLLLEAPPDAPAMATQSVKELLEDFP